MNYLKMILKDVGSGLMYLLKSVGSAIVVCAATLCALFTVIVYGEQFLLWLVVLLDFPPFVLSTRGIHDEYVANFGTGVILGLMTFLGYQRYKYVKLPWYRVLAEIIIGGALIVAVIFALLVTILGLCGVVLPFVVEWCLNDKTFVELWDALGTGQQVLWFLGVAVVAAPVGALIGLYAIDLKQRANIHE